MSRTQLFLKCLSAPTSLTAVAVFVLAACSGSENNPSMEAISKDAHPAHRKILDERLSESQFGLVAEGKLCGADNTLSVRVRPTGIGTWLVQIPGSPRNASVYSDEGRAEPVPISYAATGGPIWPWHELGLGLIGASPFAEASAQLLREEPVSRYWNAKLFLRITILSPDGNGYYKRENILLPIKVELSDE